MIIEKVLIANRGEIAVRIARTLRTLGIDSVAVFSDADRNALHVHSCDHAIHIGGSQVSESYLNGETLIKAAQLTGATAIHPGYGFLSESADFAQMVLDAGLIWIGPTPDSIRSMGDKAQAKKLMRQAGVPLARGYEGDQDPASLKQAALDVGFPLLIKATAGGGGRGIRIVHSIDEFDEALQRAKSEALNAFGDDTVLLEQYVASARHIEVQVFGDTHGNVVHLYERDCSLQRRRQKIIEEAPAFGLPKDTQKALGEAAVQAGLAIGYVGAGTVEFLYDAAKDSFFFLEMNTRLQVEHPVTEEITGLDLVEWQVLVAQGEPLPHTQDEITYSGHSIEARLYAEDVKAGFLPTTGSIAYWEPSLSDARIDTGVYSGAEISSFYDPMIAKIIVHGRSREHAIRKLRHTLRHTPMMGCTSNRDFLHTLLGNKDVMKGNYDTTYVERIDWDHSSFGHLTICAAVLLEKKSNIGWGSRGTVQWSLDLAFDSILKHIDVQVAHNEYHIISEGEKYLVQEISCSDTTLVFSMSGQIYKIAYCRQGNALFINENTHVTKVLHDDPYSRGSEGESTGMLIAPMMGRVVAVPGKQGESVTAGQVVVVIEAMKMEHPVCAQIDGLLETLNVAVDMQVQAEQVLGRITPLEEET